MTSLRLDDTDEQTTAAVASMTDADVKKRLHDLEVVFKSICSSALPEATGWKSCEFMFNVFESRTAKGKHAAAFSMWMKDTDFPDDSPHTVLDLDMFETQDAAGNMMNDHAHEFETASKAKCYVMLAVLKKLFMASLPVYIHKIVDFKKTQVQGLDKLCMPGAGILKTVITPYASVQAAVSFPVCMTVEEVMLKLAISGDLT